MAAEIVSSISVPESGPLQTASLPPHDEKNTALSISHVRDGEWQLFIEVPVDAPTPKALSAPGGVRV